MPSSDVTTRKPGSDFDWLIVQILENLYREICAMKRLTTTYVLVGATCLKKK